MKQDAALLNPQERVSAVRPMWEQRGHADRVDLLTVDLGGLKQQAKQQTDKARATAGANKRAAALAAAAVAPVVAGAVVDHAAAAGMSITPGPKQSVV